jgi:two-component system NarL family sensor kinase
VEIHLWQREKTLEGTLLDDGVGMNLTKNGDAHGVGLKSMKERIEKLGGELSIESSPGQGTKISFSITLASD